MPEITEAKTKSTKFLFTKLTFKFNTLHVRALVHIKAINHQLNAR
jgi:hypothetical protein